MFAGSREIQGPLNELIRDYKLGEQRWDGAIATKLSRVSVAAWVRGLGRRRRIPDTRFVLERMRSFRGLFLADPEDLSLLALVDFFAGDPFAGDGEMFRIAGGNDRLATAIAASLQRPPMLNAVLRRLRTDRRGVTATIEDASGGRRSSEIRADFAIVTLPAPAAARRSVRPQTACAANECHPSGTDGRRHASGLAIRRALLAAAHAAESVWDDRSDRRRVGRK